MQAAFDLLVVGPQPPALDGGPLGLAYRPIPPGELKQILLRSPPAAASETPPGENWT